MIDEILGGLADLDRRQTDDLDGELVAHFIQHGGASLGVKLPAFIHGAPADELSAKFGNAVLAIFNFGQQLSSFQRAKLWRIRQAITAPVGKVALPCSDIVVAGIEGWCIMPLAVALDRSDIAST